MTAWIRSLMCVAVAVAFVGCEPKTQPGEEGSGAPGAGGSGVTAPGAGGAEEGATKAPAGLPDTQEVLEAAQKKAAETTEAVKKTAEEVEEKATETVGEAKEAASKAMEDLANVAESTFSLEKLKELTGSLSAENLRQVADKLLAALKDQQGIVQGLQDQIANLDVADALKAPELKKQLESALSVVDGLKAKLSSVVATLKEKGLDVSKYTSALGG